MNRPTLLLALFLCLPVLLCAQDDPVPDTAVDETATGSDDSAFFDPPPGRYEQPVLLELGDGASERIQYRIEGFDESAWVDYAAPIELSAIPGEARIYRMQIRRMEAGEVADRGEGVYRIDRRRPAPPVITPLSGFYRESQTVGFEAPEGAEVYYAVSGPEFSQWEGQERVLSGEAGRRTEYLVEAYARYAGGPKSRVVSRRIVIDRDVREPQQLPLQSPAAGTWANPQLLYVDTEGFREVRYTTDGSDPADGGRLYEGPVLLESTGTTTLRVAGITVSGALLRREIEYTAGDGSLLELEQGLRQDSFQVSPPQTGVYRYRRGEDGSARLFSAPVQLSVQRGSLRTATLLVDGPFRGDEEIETFRYFFVLDGRIPTPPEVLIDVSGRTALVSMTANRGADMELTVVVNGSEAAAGTYDGPLEVPLPRGEEDGEIEVRAVSRYGEARESRETVRRVSFDTAPPPAPALGVLEEEDRGPLRTASLSADATEDARVLYELSFSGDAEEVDRFSPVLGPDGPLLELPRGVSDIAVVRLRAVDAAGNISTSERRYEIALDSLPPEPPALSISQNILSLDGRGELFYEVTNDKGGAPMFRRYAGPVRLAGAPGLKRSYAVRAYATDELGNRSAVVHREHTVDRRIPRVPDSLSAEDGASYSRAELRLQASGAPEDLLLHYTATTDGSNPPEPTIESPVLPPDSGVRFEAEDGQEVPVHVRLLPRFEGSAATGREKALSFTLDRREPSLPAVDGIEPGGVYPEPKRVELTAAEPEEDTLYVSLSEQRAGAEPHSRTFRYAEPFRLHGAPQEEVSYTLEIRVTDRAGNERRMESPFSVVVDRKPPALSDPVLVSAEGPSSGRRITESVHDGPVRLRTGEEERVRFELAEDGAAPPPVTASSPLLGETEVLAGEEGAEKVYRVAFRSEDRAGNLSRETGTLAIRIDREAPAPPDQPAVRVSADGRAARLSWTALPGHSVRYRVQGSGSQSYRPADDTEEVAIPGDDLEVSIEAVQIDAAGNRSEPTRTVVRGFTVSTQPRIVGIEDGGIYGETVVVQNETADAEVHYEVATGNEEPDAPSRFSPLLPERLPFDVSPGETVRYTLAARSFSEGARPSEEVRLSFVIDRTAPAAPRIVGARSGNFYTESKSVGLEADEGRIQYRLSLVGEADRGEFRPYEDEVMLEAKPGRLAHYQLEAYTVDQAGNRSGQPEVWDIYIDQEIVYVSTEGGEDANGSRTAPFGSLSRAVQFALAEGRRTIFVSGGTYTLAAPISVSSELTIQGGLSDGNWRRTDEQTTRIEADAGFLGDNLFEVENARLTLERLEVSASGRVQAVVTGRSAELFIQGVHMAASDSTSTLRLFDSQLLMRNGSVRTDGAGDGSAIYVAGGTAQLQQIQVSGSRSGGRLSVVRAEAQAQLEIADSRLTAGSAERGVTLDLENARITVSGSEIVAAPADETSSAIVARESTVAVRKSMLRASAEAGISTLISLSGSELRLEESTLAVTGARGATGISARESRIRVSRTSFEAGRAGEFLHVTSLRSSTADFDTNLFLDGESRELIVGRIVDSRTTWYNNTIRGGEGARFTQAFNLTGNSDTRLANNVVFHSASGAGTAVYTDTEGQRLQLTANAFSGWDVVLRERRPGQRWTPPGTDEAAGAANAAALNGRAGIDARLNIDVESRNVFSDDVHLEADAPLVDAGVYLGDAGGPTVDWDGQERPLPNEGNYDIGADEVY